MTTTNQALEVVPVSAGKSAVTWRGTFNAQSDVGDWVLLSDGATLQADGPVDACTIAIQRSLVDPSAGGALPVEVDDVTGSGGSGVSLTVAGTGPAWYRAANKATFGPATDVVERTLDSLAAAINGLQPAANGFAPGTTPQPLVVATVPTATTMLLTAATAGAAGNAIATTETLTNGAFGGAVLSGGADAVAADGTLTFTGVPTADETVTIGDITYTFVAALTGEAYEVLIGGDIEETRDNLLEAIGDVGTQATGVLTATGNPAAESTVQLGPVVYTIKTALTSAAAKNEVLRGASASDTLDNLIAAINSGAGAGTLYGYETGPNPDATAAAGAGDTIDVTSRGSGASANLIDTRESSADLSWGAVQLAGATGAGVTYGEGTDAHPDVTGAANSTDAIDITANVAGVAGNAIATTTDAADAAWGAATLENGADAVAATGTLTMSGAFVNNNTVTVGAQVYTIKTALTPTAGEVQIASTQIDVVLTGERNSNG